MRWKRLLMATALAGAAGSAAAQAPRTEAQVRAGPRDIREIFLAVPFPEADYVDDAIPLESTLATYARSEAVLQAALARGEPNVLDLRNGYLRLRLPSEIEGDSLDLVMTYFNQDGRRRLVVMQAGDMDPRNGEPTGIDYFWRLAGGRFTPVHWTDVLPRFGYRDFWGDHPFPGDAGEESVWDWHPTYIEWPRQGTTARLRVFTPGFLLDDEDTELEQSLLQVFESRRFTAMDLVWDRRRGVFTRGALTPYTPRAGRHGRR